MDRNVKKQLNLMQEEIIKKEIAFLSTSKLTSDNLIERKNLSDN